MKSKFFFLLVISVLYYTFSIGQWQWQNPTPQGNDLKDIFFLDEDLGWAVGENGVFLTTQNGGLTWENKTCDGYIYFWSDLACVCFVDPYNGWAAENEAMSTNRILHTDDGGETWEYQLFSGTDFGYENLIFTDVMHGWTVEGETHNIFRTVNGGITWENIYNANFYKLIFLDSLNGWAVGSGGIFHSSDGGINWEIQQGGSGYSLRDIYFTDPLNGWAAGYYLLDSEPYRIILHTLDGGDNWQIQSDDLPGELSMVLFSDQNEGWASGISSGGSRQIMHTADGGDSWEIYSAPPLSGDLYYINNTLWTVGIYGYMGYSTDGGQNWISISSLVSTNWLYDICFIDQENGLIAGNQGTILKTINAGNEWSLVASGTNVSLNSISYPDMEHAWAVGDSGTIIHSEDAGNSWAFQYTGITNTLNSVCFINSLSGWTVGDKIILKTINGGMNWEGISGAGEQILKDVYFIDELTGWTVGSTANYQCNPIILNTTDGGNTWEMQYSGTESCQLLSVFFIDENKGWAAGYYDSIYYTTNGGLSWNKARSNMYGGENFCLESIFFTNDLDGWTVGHLGDWNTTGLLLKTHDGGLSWEYMCYGSDGFLFDVFFVDSIKGWIAGTDGNILHTDNGGMVGVEESAVQNSKFKVQSYPNPTSGIVDFRFSMVDSRWVSLKIYDLHGREVAVVMDGKCSGDQVVRWYAKGLPAGIYFYRLTTDDQRQTTQIGKIVLNH